MAKERREAAEGQDRLAMKVLAETQRTRCRRLAAAWWERKLRDLNSGRTLPGTRELNELALDAGIVRPAPVQTELLNKDGEVVSSKADRLVRWHEHFCELFACKDVADVDVEKVSAAAARQLPVRTDLDTTPTVDEVSKAIAALKNKKAAGADGVHAELLKNGGADVELLLHRMIERCWCSGKVPKNWRDAVLIPLPKKGDLRACDNWRGIALLSVCGKVLAKIVAQRLTMLSETVLDESANGFRPNRGVVDRIFLLRALINKAVGSDKGALYTIFVDLNK